MKRPSDVPGSWSRKFMGRTGGGAVSLITFLACPLTVALETVAIVPWSSALVKPMTSGGPGDHGGDLGTLVVRHLHHVDAEPRRRARAGVGPGSVMLTVAMFLKKPPATSGARPGSVRILVSLRSTAKRGALVDLAVVLRPHLHRAALEVRIEEGEPTLAPLAEGDRGSVILAVVAAQRDPATPS
jgi:hypothetical protein